MTAKRKVNVKSIKKKVTYKKSNPLKSLLKSNNKTKVIISGGKKPIGLMKFKW